MQVKRCKHVLVHARRSLLAAQLLALAGCLCASLAQAETWLTGVPLKKQLQQAVSVTWSGSPLRQVLADLSKSQRVAIVLDRRVDPDQKIELSLHSVPLEEALRRIASRARIGVCQFGPVAYLGPADATSRLRTLAALRKAELAGLPPAARIAFARSRAWTWNDLATPRELLTALAKEAGIEIQGLEQIPHDLWAAADVPPLALADRLTLVAGQFDLTFEYAGAGKAVLLLPIPEQVAIERTYGGGANPNQLAAQIRRQFPTAEVEASGGKVVVRGRVEDHELIQAALSGARPTRKTVTEGQQAYSLTFEGSVATILKELERTGLTFKVDRTALEAAGSSLETIVTVKTDKASLDELLKAVLTPAGLTFRQVGTVVEIMPAKLP